MFSIEYDEERGNDRMIFRLTKRGETNDIWYMWYPPFSLYPIVNISLLVGVASLDLPLVNGF